jgi:predicted MPP superfamily phosphohydrolase
LVIKDVLRNLIDLATIAIVIWAQWQIGTATLSWSSSRPGWTRRLIKASWIIACLGLAAGFVLTYHVVNRFVHIPVSLRGALSGFAYMWAFSSTGALLARRAWRFLLGGGGASDFSPGRRTLVNAAGNALVAAPFALTGFGALIQRTDFQVREVNVPIPNLPTDLRGLRILQLTDIHLGPYLSERDLARVIDESQNLRAHLAVITGDLISMGDDPLDACLRQVARLRPDAGIIGCLGNHEVYAGVERYTTEQGARLGIDFLRGRARPFRFGASTLNVAGVDYQSVSSRKSYLKGAERLIEPGAVNVLLSHNPDVFPVAARQGFDFTVAGHTHGGQVTVEILHQSLNVARFITPFVYGAYSLPRPSGLPASIYVSRGIGTIGLPVRIGAPPEITLLRLVPA